MGRVDEHGQFVSSSSVQRRFQDGIAVLELSNPPVNAIDTNLVRQFGEALQQVESDSSVRALIVTASGGRVFSAGSDILEMSTMLAPGEAVERKLSLQFEVFGRLAALEIPTIAALAGDTLGGGLEVAACCDLIVAEEQIVLGSPEIRVGLFPSSGGTFRVARRIGPGRAKQMQMLGEPISAAQALGWGLVNEVVPTGQALTVATERAGTLLSRPAIGLRMVKRLIDNSVDLDEQSLIRLSLASSELAFTSPAGREGINAFLHKRQAQFPSS